MAKIAWNKTAPHTYMAVIYDGVGKFGRLNVYVQRPEKKAAWDVFTNRAGTGNVKKVNKQPFQHLRDAKNYVSDNIKVAQP